MEIKVLGSGCSRCKKALEVVNKVVGESGIDANVEYVTDIMRVMEYNVMGTPAVRYFTKIQFPCCRFSVIFDTSYPYAL